MTRAKRLGRTDHMLGLDLADFSTLSVSCLDNSCLVPKLGPTVHGGVLVLPPELLYLTIEVHTELSGDHLVSSSADVHGVPGAVENADAIMGKLFPARGSEQPILVVLIFRRC